MARWVRPNENETMANDKDVADWMATKWKSENKDRQKREGIFECDKENCDLNKKITLKKENKES